MKTTKVIDLYDIPANYTGIANGPCDSKHWLLGGKYHREDGPAMEFDNGAGGWFLDGSYYTEEDHKKEMAIRNSSIGKLLNKAEYNLEEK